MGQAARERSTVEALDAFDDDERIELIDGEIVREDATSFAHGDAQAALIIEIGSRFRRTGGDGRPGWWIAPEVTVVYEPTQVFVHDIAGWRKARVPSRPEGRRVTVRPDWVCEILSANKRNDLVSKRRVLHEHEVPHYWIVDPDALVLTVYRWHAEGYLLVNSVSPGEVARLEPFESVELDVSLLLGDLEAGEAVSPKET
ncbi:MAG: Uma2 family endonuclease [Deltaproteobacteria bacterium]|nr:Uma2 family endonuclease [Deltaproteobacteria bacterium]